jgi:hypothetical protein
VKRVSVLLVLATLICGVPALASSAFEVPLQAAMKAAVKAASDGSFDWKVGDTLNYQMQFKPLPIMGTNSIAVTKDTADGYWLTETVQVKSFKQVSQVLIDKDTGEVKKMIVNGKEQDAPDAGESTVVKAEEAHLSVPAGSFDCIHFIIEDRDHNQTEQWVNPRDLPISGMVKSISVAGSAIQVVTELTRFAHGK